MQVLQKGGVVKEEDVKGAISRISYTPDITVCNGEERGGEERGRGRRRSFYVLFYAFFFSLYSFFSSITYIVTQVLAKECMFVIEAVFEDLAVKREVFTQLDTHAPSHVILASNTSSLSIATISECCHDPSRVLAVHFLHPAHLVPLVEITPTPRTSPAVVERSRELLTKIGKSPILLKKVTPSLTSYLTSPHLTSPHLTSSSITSSYLFLRKFQGIWRPDYKQPCSARHCTWWRRV